jgi:excisionase family DNA binding protein
MSLLTTKDAADKLGVTVQRIHALIKDERLPAQRLGRDYVINEDDLALVADRKPGRPKKADEAEAVEASRKSAPVKATKKRAAKGKG